MLKILVSASMFIDAKGLLSEKAMIGSCLIEVSVVDGESVSFHVMNEAYNKIVSDLSIRLYVSKDEIEKIIVPRQCQIVINSMIVL